MTERILMVDDDERVLSSYQRSLRLKFDLVTALGPFEGLRKVEAEGPFAVVVADMQMPGLNGIHFLERIKALSPDTVRIMLTGNADQHTAVEAVNRGQIFRFLNKPCPVPDITRALEMGLDQFRLVTAERELLEKTLSGAVQVLTDLLSLADPAGYHQVEGLLDYCLTVARMLEVENVWALRLAVMLGQIGRLTLPRGLMDRVILGQPLEDRERALVTQVPETSARLLAHIPRLEEVIRIIRYQDHPYLSQASGASAPPEEAIPLGARILGCVKAYMELESRIGSAERALQTLQNESGRFDPRVLGALWELVGPAGPPLPPPRALRVEELETGMILASDVLTLSGILLCSKSTRVTLSHLEKIRNFARLFGIRTPILVRVDDPRPS